MNGILLVDKPADWTSHDVVAKLRGVLGERRMGHSGTLDPMATGLLVVFAGRATRAVSFSENHSKCYEARLRLGLTTDTQDTTGTVLSRCDRRVTRTELEAVLPQFRGDILQVPPMYSALKVDGKKLYEIARRGGEVAREARPITIEELTVLGEADGDYVLRVRCSKGTYIRTLCHDIGAALGCGGVMSALRRTAVGGYRVEACAAARGGAAPAPAGGQPLAGRAAGHRGREGGAPCPLRQSVRAQLTGRDLPHLCCVGGVSPAGAGHGRHGRHDQKFFRGFLTYGKPETCHCPGLF